MYKARLHNILLSLLLAAGFLCSAQQSHQQWFITTYAAGEGITDIRNGILKEGPGGFLWMGTGRGLGRFDGRSFTTFTTLDGLRENTVTDIKFDQAGFVYVATPSAIHRYTGGFPAFFRYPVTLAAGYKAICPENSDRIWMAVAFSDTLYRWEKQQVLAMPVKGPVEAIEQDQNGYIYALTAQQQLYIIKETQVKQSLYLPGINVTRPRPMYKDKNGWIWCAGYSQVYRLGAGGITDSLPHPAAGTESNTGGQLKGPFYIDSNALLQWQHCQWDTLLPLSAIGAAVVEDITEDKAGHYRLLTARGLLHLYPRVYNKATWPDPRYCFTSPSAGCTLLMNNSPVYHHRLYTLFFNRLQPDLAGVYQSRDSVIFYLTRYGLYYLLPAADRLQPYIPPVAGDSSAIHFTGAAEDASGNIWFTTPACLYHYKSGRFTPYHLPSNRYGRQVHSIAIDRHQAVYAAAGQLYVFHKNGFRALSCQQASLGNRVITGVTTDDAKDLWIWTDSSLLYKIAPGEHGCFMVTDSFEVAVNGQAAIPEALTFDQNGNLWVATRSSLHIFLNLPGDRFSRSHQLVLDKEQRISDLTQEGCRLFRGAYNDVYLLDGTEISRFNGRQLLQHYYRSAPSLYFTGVLLDNQPQNWVAKESPTTPTGMPVTLNLPSAQHSISILYKALCPVGADGIVYRYKLLGMDNDWQPITRAEKADYTFLPAGNYTFLIQAANASGVWCEPVSYTFSIAPAWYATPRARLLLLMLVTLALLTLTWYTLQMRRQKKELENIVIEQQLKTLRAQINPHFLQNSFEFLAQSIRFGNLETSITIIHRIARYFRHILYKSDESIVTLEAELESAEEYLALKKMILYDAFHYTVHIAEEVDTFGVRLPSLLLQPLVENALKYGIDKTSKTGHIGIDVRQDEHFVLIAITDTGFRLTTSPVKKEDPSSKGKGMDITRRRLSLLYQRHRHKPSINLQPNQAGGTTVEVKIPLS